MPSSPRKKWCVIENLAKQVGLEIVISAPPQRSSALSEDTKSAVNAYYLSIDVTWQAPGRKDRVIIQEKNSEGKVEKGTEQTQYMVMSLMEAHAKFDKDHPNKIGLGKFYNLRPANVKLFDHIPHHVYLCSYHENVCLLLVALREHTSLPVEFHISRSQMNCDTNAEICELQGQH